MLSKISSHSLFEEVLVQPALEGATELHIVSGFVSPAMISRHVQELEKRGISGLEIDITAGMTGRDGIPKFVLSGLQALPRVLKGSKLNLSLTLPGVSFNSKIYLWGNNNGPFRAWTGSANYTQIGFGLASGSPTHTETLAEIDPQSAWEEIRRLGENTISASHPQVAQKLTLRDSPGSGEESLMVGPSDPISARDEFVLLPLVQTQKSPGKVHEKSGLNWDSGLEEIPVRRTFQFLRKFEQPSFSHHVASTSNL